MRFTAITHAPFRLAVATLAAVAVAALPTAPSSAGTTAHGPARPHVIHANPQAAAARDITATGSGKVVATRTFRLHKLASPRPARTLSPHAAQSVSPSLAANFEGLNQAAASAAGVHLTPNAVSMATNGSKTLETVGNTVAGYDINGNQVCTTIPIQQLLPGQGPFAVEDGQLEYDAANGHFVLMAAVPAGGDNVGTIWVATSDTSDPCGSWFAVKLTLSGDQFPAGGTCLEHASLGQNSAGVLVGISTGQFCDGPAGSDVFALPKNTLYAHNTLSFPVFNLSGTEGVAAMEYPAFGTSAGYFVLATPSVVNTPSGGYTLYRMNGAGGGIPTMTQQASFTAPWFPPATPTSGLDNELNQGQISSATWDGTRLWFAHIISAPGGPQSALRYGFIDTTNNTLQLASASHSTSSNEFNPSIGVGVTFGQVDTVFLNWATVDNAHGLAPSPTVAAMFYNGGSLPNLQAADHLLVTGGTPTQDEAVGVSSAVQAGTTCAWTAQQYWDAGNSWHTRLATVCAPGTVGVPNVTGSTPAAAQTAITNAFLTVFGQSGTTACSPSQNGLVITTDPPAGAQANVGTAVTLNVCDVVSTVPNVLGLDDGVARSLIGSAGLTVGAVRMTANCTVEAGGVLTQNPTGGTQVARGTAVTLSESTGKKSNGQPCVVN